MTFNFKKNTVIGVSITPERGLEAAVVDFPNRAVVRYAKRDVAYDNMKREIADLDIFKDSLKELLEDIGAPKGSLIALNIPTVYFKVTDYPAAIGADEVQIAIEEDLSGLPLFQNTDSDISAVRLPNSTVQFNKIAITAAQKTPLVEVAIQIKELGYKLCYIDTSINSTLNSLIYNGLPEMAPDTSWVLLTIENNYCRICSMAGTNYVDAFEEKISIGEVLGDEENYATVLMAINPILAKIPSKFLYIVSKTDIISAKVLAEKVKYSAQIIHYEANVYSSEPFLDTSALIDDEGANNISLDVIGAAIKKERISFANFNLYNESLGDIYLNEQPFVIQIGATKIVASIENMLRYGIIFAAIVALICGGIYYKFVTDIHAKNEKLNDLNKQIEEIEKFLKENENVSAEKFNEADEINIGLARNKNVYSYYSIVGTEIPQKLWLTELSLGDHTTIAGQADNLESVYSFFRNIKDYNPSSDVKLQKLGLATKNGIKNIDGEEAYDTDSIITSMNADFYEFKISDIAEPPKNRGKKNKDNENKSKSETGLPQGLKLEPID